MSNTMQSPILPETPEVRRLGALALFAALYTYALILAGGIVRITGSGMGCGDHWPKCNGVWIPEFTTETLIEYTHRSLAAGIGLVVLIVLGYVLKHRAKPGFSGPGGLVRPIVLGAVLVVIQALLGMVTVKMDLPTSVIVVHFITALMFATTLLVASVRAGTFGGVHVAPSETEAQARKVWRLAMASAVFGLVLIALGALTANTPGAPLACQGFPLCNGSFAPPKGPPAGHIHFTHRMLAYLFFLHVMGAGTVARRLAVSKTTRNAILAVQLGVVVQILVAAFMILAHLPPHWQAMHLATGAALWFALASWVACARRDFHATLVEKHGGEGLSELDPIGTRG
jgi:heme A synthase